jgi:hypothetical protein
MTEMPLDLDIDRIVREVLAQYGVLPQGGPSTSPFSSSETGDRAIASESERETKDKTRAEPSAAAATPPAAPAVPSTTPGDFVIHRKVVTADDLPQRWDGVRRVVVPRRAVLTPSVRDTLQSRHIAIAFADAAPVASGQSGVLLVAMGKSIDPAGLEKALRDDGYAVEREKTNCLIAASARFEEEFRTGKRLAVLLTKHAAAAVCLANRREGVRAVRALSVESVKTDADAVGANLLVVDPTHQGFFVMRQMVRQFVRGGLRACPEVFRKQLG